MRLLITGITSIHGWPLFQYFRDRLPSSDLLGIAPPATSPDTAFQSLCLTDPDVLQRVRDEFKPTQVLHCGGVCDLDACEARPDWAYAMNVTVAENMARIFGSDTPIIYMSTDLVYSGINPPEDGYTEHDVPDPVSVVGNTMLMAEAQFAGCPDSCILRLGLPLGPSFQGDKGAVDWIESRYKKGKPATLFYDEYRSCVNCEDIGPVVERVIQKGLQGIYHFGGKRAWSLYEIGEYVLSRGPYEKSLLVGRNRVEEKNGPPRIGNVALNSLKLIDAIKHITSCS